MLIGYNSRSPALPPRPAGHRTRRQPRAARPAPDRSEKERKQSLSRAPPMGGAKHQPMAGLRPVTRMRAPGQRDPGSLSGRGRGVAPDPEGGQSPVPPPLFVYTGRMMSVRRWAARPRRAPRKGAYRTWPTTTFRRSRSGSVACATGGTSSMP